MINHYNFKSKFELINIWELANEKISIFDSIGFSSVIGIKCWCINRNHIWF